MKEVIAERDKGSFLFITVIALISLIGSVMGLIFIPRFRLFYIIGVSVMGFITLVGIISICFPKWVIIKKDDAITIQNGFRGLSKIKITDIVGAKVQEASQQIKDKNKGNIILTVKSENSSTKDIVALNIKNISDAVEKLNLLIQK